MLPRPRQLVPPKSIPTTSLPVVAVVLELPASSYMPAHQHPHGHLIHAMSGTIDVISDGKSWTLPPHRALWLPAGLEHEMSTRSPASMRSLDLADALARKLPAKPIAVNVGPMLHALVHRAVELGTGYRADRHALALLRAIPEELLRSPKEQVELPFPSDRRISRICRSLLDGDGLKHPLSRWAEDVGASVRTLERLFVAETGMTFVRWRQAALMQIAVSRLAAGKSIRQVCEELEVQSASAFHRTFRSIFGMPPIEYLRSHP